METTKLEIRKPKLASNARQPVKDFTDLHAWQAARVLRKKVYELTKGFPTNENHVLSPQIRRAALLVTANIAEGFGRFSYQENIQYCRLARGSAFEVREHLTTALDAGYLAAKHLEGNRFVGSANDSDSEWLHPFNPGTSEV